MGHEGSLNGIPLMFALIGAICDWIYLRRGGKRPTSREKVVLVIATFVLFGSIVLLSVRGASNYALGEATGDFTSLLFVCWEAGRWWTRHRNPLERKV